MPKWIASSIGAYSQSLREEIESSMRDVRVACADWAKMRGHGAPGGR